MTKTQIYLTSILAFFVASLGGLFLYASYAGANPMYFITSNGTATATSSPVYMTPGTATTTEYFDAGIGTSQALNKAKLLVQFAGTSTASRLKIDLEYSHGVAGVNCTSDPTACDWYSNNMSGQDAAVSTTTEAMVFNGASFSFNFSSTSPGGAGGNATTNKRIFSVDTPVRYVRAVASMPIGSFNGAVWMRFVGEREL